MTNMNNSGVMFIGIIEAVGIILSIFLFGLNLLVPIYAGLIVLALTLKGFGTVAVFIWGNISLGLGFSAFLWGDFLLWIVALSGIAAIAIIVTHFMALRNNSREVM